MNIVLTGEEFCSSWSQVHAILTESQYPITELVFIGESERAGVYFSNWFQVPFTYIDPDDLGAIRQAVKESDAVVSAWKEDVEGTLAHRVLEIAHEYGKKYFVQLVMQIDKDRDPLYKPVAVYGRDPGEIEGSLEFGQADQLKKREKSAKRRRVAEPSERHRAAEPVERRRVSKKDIHIL